MAEVVEMRAWGGGQVDSDGHGDVTVGVRRGPWRAELYTDTLELAWEPSWATGRAWIQARGSAFAAEMMLSPWTDGGPDAARGMGAAAVGAEGGALRFFGSGGYTGGRANVRHYTFFPFRDGEATLPDHPVARFDAIVGRWTPALQGELRLGARLEPTAEVLVQPHVEAELRWRPELPVAPIIEVRAALAEGQSELTRTRLGGLTPYVVPVAGAAWAEWWVEDYVAARVGARAGPTWPHGELRGELGVDLAGFSAETAGDPAEHAEGLYAAGHTRWRRLYGDIAVGYAPWIERQAGVSRVSVYFRLGLDWAPVGGPRPG